jgi:hypothetical protein
MNFDVLMPSILFVVTLAAMLLGKRAEAKLKATVEEREFKTRDVALLVGLIAVAVSVVAFFPELAIMGVFLFSYSSLLFTVSYAFSDLKKKSMTLYCGVFIVASILAGAAAFLGVLPAELRFYGTVAFAGLASAAFVALFFAQRQTQAKQRWYIAALAPVLFLLLFFFYSGTGVWFPYLLDVYGIIFALLIVIYLSTLFRWKTVFIFAAFLTAMDIVLVWVTGAMVQAANAVSGLGLPVLVAFPTIPFLTAESGILLLRLGLGDFFFSGILTTQTMKKFGMKTAVLSLVTICVSFGLFELFLLNKELFDLLPVKALPATLPILVGWLPVVAVKIFITRKKKPPPEMAKDAPLPPVQPSAATPKVFAEETPLC